MNRIPDISAPEDFELEVKREVLRDWRWRRHRSKLFAGVVCLVALLVPLGLGLHATFVLTLLR